MNAHALSAAALLLAPLAGAQVIDEHAAPDHQRHTHHHNPPHPASHDPDRFVTSRDSSVSLPLPGEQEGGGGEGVGVHRGLRGWHGG